jgi:hypothetical protein
MLYNLLYRRHIGHIESKVILKNYLNFKEKYAFLCVLFAYVL